MPACPEEQSTMIDARFGRRPQNTQSRPARRSLQWLRSIECLESRIALSHSASYNLAGGAISVIGTTAALTAHAAPDGFGDLARIGRHPVIHTSVAQTGHAAPYGFGDL
jgi:hypothetical protein